MSAPQSCRTSVPAIAGFDLDQSLSSRTVPRSIGKAKRTNARGSIHAEDNIAGCVLCLALPARGLRERGKNKDRACPGCTQNAAGRRRPPERLRLEAGPV